ncbi:MAG: serine/threonine-protein kinase M1 [Trizodia sp. TS-e1964]|nr:MAG: serine/threonine-protein kinase M1 [Trizodia sp. TS-e1964]
MARGSRGVDFISPAKDDRHLPESSPSSSLAIRVAETISQGHGQRQTIDQGTFEQLLAEAEAPELAEFDTTVNYNLIHVVVTVGLDYLLSDSPFEDVLADQQHLLSRASNSLSVIRLTIQRTPEVLFHDSNPKNTARAASRPTLFFWLLSKTFRFFGHKKFVTLHGKLNELLISIITATSGSPTIWNRAHEMLLYLQSCVDAPIEQGLYATMFLRTYRAALDSLPRTAQAYKAMTLLTQNCAKTIQLIPNDINAPLQKELGLTLLDLIEISDVHEMIGHANHVPLEPFISDLIQSKQRFGMLSKDLQLAIAIYAHKRDSDETDLDAVELLTSDENGNLIEFSDAELRAHYITMRSSYRPIIELEAVRPHKRRRTAITPKQKAINIATELTKSVYSLLGTQIATDLDGLHLVAAECFAKLSETDKVQSLNMLGYLACAGSGVLSVKTANHHSISSKTCSICDVPPLCRNSINPSWKGAQFDEVYMILSNLVQTRDLQNSSKSRVCAMLALRRILNHTSNTNHLDLAHSPLGKWCLQSHFSSVRELRIAAGRTLPVYLRLGFNGELLLKNWHHALEFLRNLSKKNELSLQESCIFSWGQIARVSANDELNISLIQLVDYLGHTNSFVHGLSFTELQKLADVQKAKPRSLIAPFWRNIAITVVRDLQNRPQAVQLLSDLIEVDVSEFLLLTQSYTLPYLILMKKHDVILRILQALKLKQPLSSILFLCCERSNVAAILALLFVENSENIETATMKMLRAATSDFKGFDLEAIAKIEPIITVCELLQMAGKEDSPKLQKVIRAINFLAEIVQRESGQYNTPAKKGDLLGSFFEWNLPGIMIHFSEIVTSPSRPALEKRRCLCGIEQMIVLAKNYINRTLPQICACLQSALDIKDIRDQAFLVWITMINTLNQECLETLVASTFSIAVQHWDRLLSSTQQQAHSMISRLFKERADLISNHIKTIPSLASIPLMENFEAILQKVKSQIDIKQQFQAFHQRCQHENVMVVYQALTEFLVFLQTNQSLLQGMATSEQPDPLVGKLIRAVLDACVKYNETRPDVASLCAQCIGLIGCLDPNVVEADRKQQKIVVVSNFEDWDESVDFVLSFLQEILIDAFLSAPNPTAQSFFAFVIQELLAFCKFSQSALQNRESLTNPHYKKWHGLSQPDKSVLAPFLSSRYVLASAAPNSISESKHPIYSPKLTYADWLRAFLSSLIQKSIGPNSQNIFSLCTRLVRFQDISIAKFLLPFVVLNVILNGSDSQRNEIGEELFMVLRQELPDDHNPNRDHLKLCIESIFQVLDYCSKWIKERKKAEISTQQQKQQPGGSHRSIADIRHVEQILYLIPAEIMSRRAVECKSYARGLFYWEQHIRHQKEQITERDTESSLQPLFERLQYIYTQIDEPDGIEGISAQLQVLDIDQQILEHRKAGRWTAAQTWYELQLAEKPGDIEVQLNLLTCLKESGQHDVLLNQIEGFNQTELISPKLLPYAVEAAWVTGKWSTLQKHLAKHPDALDADFNVNIAKALVKLYKKELPEFSDTIKRLFEHTARGLSAETAATLPLCHGTLLKLHVLTEIEMISGVGASNFKNRNALLRCLDNRLGIVGSFLSNKQYLLGLRRATMQISQLNFKKDDIASVWLTSARLARKENFTHQSFNAVMHASQLGAHSATIEHSRLLWKEGHHRKAIQSLEGAIAANAFVSYNIGATQDDIANITVEKQQENQLQQNILLARAHLLSAKWLESAGQTQSESIIARYKKAILAHPRWEKGHYYMGRHYNKLFESEKSLPPNKQSEYFITGETARLVFASYLRSLSFGTKYIFQTLPRLLTLWLDLGSLPLEGLDPRYGSGKDFQAKMLLQQKNNLRDMNELMERYMEKLPAYIFYTALSQMVARICHPNTEVYRVLQAIIVRVVSTFPRQALWTLLAVAKSSEVERSHRGLNTLYKIKDSKRRKGSDTGGLELKTLIAQGQKLSDELLKACEKEIPGKPVRVSLKKNLGFNTKTAPCALVVPLETTLTASLPSMTETVKGNRAFARDTVTIDSFLDEVLVLQSLQRPRRISVRGSDGRVYGLLCKPKDDLRKDQRLMEFNAMINRFLKKDSESSKRRLCKQLIFLIDIKTYAVTPLNEECGLIEWVDNLKALRDILLPLYRSRGIQPNYGEIRILLDEAISEPSKLSIFDKKVLKAFSPVFHEWFVEMFPEADSWFSARLKYTRSCAVMSMVGMVLGLGDRHGENVLLEENTGGIFHVDFNCLFDKGLTFEKPELVPFRLTHNMTDAFGAYGYEGPFRKSCELTMRILRQNEETLMTILETFVYDPTTDFMGKKAKTATAQSVRLPTPSFPRYSHTRQKKIIKPPSDTPKDVLESVRAKVQGLLTGESVPLSVEGHVQELILQATSHRNLAAMYIGWCAFF